MALVTRNVHLFAVLACFTAISGTNAKKMLRDIGNITRQEVEDELAVELAGHIAEEQITDMMNAMRPMYDTLPKNSHNRVGHQAVRYALHRLFVSRRGWYIKGLEPTSKATALSTADWVPSLVQDRLEEHLGQKGMNLHELGSLAAVMEDLIRKEAGKRLETVYEVLLLPTDEPISYQEAIDAINTYTMVHLLGGKKNFSIADPGQVARMRSVFVARYRNFSEFDHWFEKIEVRHIGNNREADIEFSSVKRLVEEFGEEYGSLNDVECRALKAALSTNEGPGRGVGRLRLSDFYNMTRYSHWKLHEKIEYLRDLGALDESNESVPMVIVANYITSRPNCLEATPLYSVCCRNECEDLIGTLERNTATPKANPSKILEIVAGMSSDTVAAPRTLSDNLIKRLTDIATLHSGNVDMHSRLFAQWMHHAFPRECPYPQEAGTTNPVSADEWMTINGHQSTLASAEDIQQILNNAADCGDNAADSEDAELPWSHVEELLDPHYETLLDEVVLWSAQRSLTEPQPVVALYGLVLLTGALWILLGLYLGRFRKTLGIQPAKKVGTFLCTLLLVGGAIAADLVDQEVVAIMLVLGLVLDVFHNIGGKIFPRRQIVPKQLV